MRLMRSFALTALGLAATATAQSPGQMPAPQIEAWIEMLDSPRYADRAEATRRLRQSGAPAIDALEQVLRGGSVEASNRALEILSGHYSSDDPILKEASTDALKRIADQDDHPKSKAAHRILQPAPSAAPDPNPIPIPVFPPPAANRRIRIQVRITNGDKDITVEENGKTIRVIENGDGIQVEKSDQQGRIVKSKFKDVAELKEKDAEAHQAYGRATLGGQILTPANRRDPPALPGPQQARLHDELQKRHEEIRQKHQEMLERMRKGPTAPPDVPIPPPPIDTKTKDPLEI